MDSAQVPDGICHGHWVDTIHIRDPAKPIFSCGTQPIFSSQCGTRAVVDRGDSYRIVSCMEQLPPRAGTIATAPRAHRGELPPRADTIVTALRAHRGDGCAKCGGRHLHPWLTPAMIGISNLDGDFYAALRVLAERRCIEKALSASPAPRPGHAEHCFRFRLGRLIGECIRPCAADEVTAVEACCYLGVRWGQWITQAHAFRRKAGAKWLPEPRAGTIYSRYAIYVLSDIRRVAENGTFRKHGPVGTLPEGRSEARFPVFSAPDHAMLVRLCDAEIRRLVKDEDMRQTIWMQIVETDVVGKYEMSDRRIPFLSYLKAAVWHRLQNQQRGMSRALAREACVDLVVDLPDVADRRQNQEPIVDARMFVRKLDDLPRKDRDGLLARLDDDDSDGLSRVLRRAFPTVTARRPIEERLSAWLPPGEELSPNG